MDTNKSVGFHRDLSTARSRSKSLKLVQKWPRAKRRDGKSRCLSDSRMKRGLHVHDSKFVLQRTCAHACPSLKGSLGERWIVAKNAGLVQKCKALAAKKQYRWLVCAPLAFTNKASRFELVETLFGCFAPSLKVQRSDVRSSHYTRFKEAP